jgi:hypothetical protein
VVVEAEGPPWAALERAPEALMSSQVVRGDGFLPFFYLVAQGGAGNFQAVHAAVGDDSRPVVVLNQHCKFADQRAWRQGLLRRCLTLGVAGDQQVSAIARVASLGDALTGSEFDLLRLPDDLGDLRLAEAGEDWNALQ